MNEPTCVWSRGLADEAVKTVLKLGTALIIKRIPSQRFVYLAGEGKNMKMVKVSRERILSVFNWIISQTKGFRIPLLVNFRHGDAPTIALGMIRALSPHLSIELYALEKVGKHMPSVQFGWDGGPGRCYVLISNLSRTQGKMGFPLDGVKIINIHGVRQQPERIILLEKIPL